MDTKQKYVRLKQYDTIIIFPEGLNHSDFKHMNPISAGFCCVEKDKVQCFGESYSLRMKSDSEDTKLATKQIFGIDTMLALL
jgi:spore cortex formation protein SpoVR/YcgB (stage V sporulation)